MVSAGPGVYKWVQRGPLLAGRRSTDNAVRAGRSAACPTDTEPDHSAGTGELAVVSRPRRQRHHRVC